MKYNNLIVFLTDRCRSRCSTCNVRAVPENSGMLRLEDIDILFSNPPVLKDTGKYVIWTGGEPFENFTTLEYGISMAAKSGFRSEVLSSGYWFGEAPERLGKLEKTGGPFSLRISIDREHLEFTGEGLLLRLAEACIMKKIELNFTVRDIPGNNDFAETILSKIEKRFPEYAEKKQKDPRWIHHIPHVTIDKYDTYETEGGSSLADTGCKMVFRDLVAGWDGNIYPCCGLFSLPGFERYSTGCFRIGNVLLQSQGRANNLFRLIGEKGIPGIIGKFGPVETGIENKAFPNQCSACIYYIKKYRTEIDTFLSGEI